MSGVLSWGCQVPLCLYSDHNQSLDSLTVSGNLHLDATQKHWADGYTIVYQQCVIQEYIKQSLFMVNFFDKQVLASALHNDWKNSLFCVCLRVCVCLSAHCSAIMVKCRLMSYLESISICFSNINQGTATSLRNRRVCTAQHHSSISCRAKAVLEWSFAFITTVVKIKNPAVLQNLSQAENSSVQPAPWLIKKQTKKGSFVRFVFSEVISSTVPVWYLGDVPCAPVGGEVW